MYLSNRKKMVSAFKYVFLILVLTSCAGREKHLASDLGYASNAPFIAEQITKPANLSKSINFIEKNGLKDVFIVNLSTCLKDSFKKDNSIQETPFSIIYENTNKEKIKVQVTSDVNGCIRWEEEYKYRYVIKPKWIVLKRTIKKEEGAYFGQVEIPLAVNPWLEISNEKFPEILDLRKNYSEKYPIFKKHPYEKNGLKYLSKDEVSEYPQLWAPEVDLQIEKKLLDRKETNLDIRPLLKKYQNICNSKRKKDCYKRDLRVNLTVPLKLRTYSLQKDLVDQTVKGGSYKVSLQLLIVPDRDKKHYRVNENICSEVIHISNSKDTNQRTKYINLSCDIPISYFSENSNYKLALEIKPESGLPFTKFQGVYTINLFQEIKSGSLYSYTIDNDLDSFYKKLPMAASIIKNMDIKYIYDTVKSVKNRDITDTKQLSKLDFHPAYLNVKLKKTTFSNVENTEKCSENETVVRKKVRFIGIACIEDVLTGHRNKKIEFRVFIEDGNTNEIVEVFSNTKKKTIPRTDAEGCISWPDTIEHKNFNRQVYFPRKVHFLSEELNLYGTTDVAINPWQRAFQSYQDISQLSRDEIRTNAKGVDKPQMVINQFKSVNLFPSYVLDKFLNIHLFHSLYFLFQPFITRTDNISIGKDHRSREVLRDGYYILRILLLRNPQETESISRVVGPKVIEKMRNSPLPKPYYRDGEYIKTIINDKVEGKYITHLDTIIKSSANFVNIYTPLYFSKEQFFYLASRNLISIQVIPIDPSGFKFKPVTNDRTTCEIDFQKTEWKPFFNHDLITKPYVGVFQVQNWTNWNILQPMSKEFNTDRFIDADKEGKNYRHFNLYSSSTHKKATHKKATLKAPVIEYKEDSCNNKDIDSTDFNVESCKPTDVTSNYASDPGVDAVSAYYKERNRKAALEKNKGIKKDITSDELIDSFAERNSLKTVHLFREDGSRFLEDLNRSYDKSGLIIDEDEDFIDAQILDSISNLDIKKDIQLKIEEHCGTTSLISSLFKFITSSKYEACVSKVIGDALFGFIKKEDSYEKPEKFQDYLKLEMEQSEVRKLIQFIMNNHRLPTKVSSVLMGKVSRSLENIIDKGISDKNKKDPEIVTFAKSLCGFWSDSYFKKYLTSDQMRTSYTDYIKNFDYYRVLESEVIRDDEKGDFIVSFMNLISGGDTEGEKSLKECHINYGNCILVDHCKLRDHSNAKTYCSRASKLKDPSCLKVVEEECERDSSTAICKAKVTANNCHHSLNSFCTFNINHEICNKYSSRCLTNYHACTKSNEILKDLKESTQDMDLFKITHNNKKLPIGYGYMAHMYENHRTVKEVIKAPLLKSCLADPLKFFQLESKMFIEEISDSPPKYIGGFAGNITISGSFSTGSYMNWTSQRGSSLGLKHGASLSLGLAGKSKLLNLTAMDLNISKSISSNTSNSSRRAIDIRVAEGTFLVFARATIDIGVTKFKKCMVIKPRSNAFFAKFEDGIWESYTEDDDIWSEGFNQNPYKKIMVSRSGLMICNPQTELEKDNPQTIRESYYYISQALVDPSNSQFLNLYDLANRPFMAIIRGRKDFLNYFSGLRSVMEGEPGNLEKNTRYNALPDNMFAYYPHPVDEAISFSLSSRDLQKTGFHPGVYSYSYSNDDFNRDYIDQNSWIAKLFKSYDDFKIFPLPAPPNSKIPVINE